MRDKTTTKNEKNPHYYFSYGEYPAYLDLDMVEIIKGSFKAPLYMIISEHPIQEVIAKCSTYPFI